MTHSAALIAGGKSTRMGRDKAALRRAGCPLWLAQLGTLAATQPAEIFVAGKCAPIPAGTVEMIADLREDCGPLGGIAAALKRARAPWVMVLAVDMPAMTPEFLLAMLRRAQRKDCGVVPHFDDGFEPLAAIYPADAAPIAVRMLEEGRLALREFIGEAMGAGLLVDYPVEWEERRLFANMNTPDEAREHGAR
jgi:molybdopterin-guanine dinucleotide biosynthesis protein A